MDLENNLHTLKLFDLYGALLTEKQKSCMEDYLINNLTLSEISEIYGISRQAVNFNIKESIKLLNSYEERLGLCQKYDTISTKLLDMKIDKATIDLILSILKG